MCRFGVLLLWFSCLTASVTVVSRLPCVLGLLTNWRSVVVTGLGR